MILFYLLDHNQWSKNRRRMTFWTVIVCFCTLFFLYQVYMMVTRYLRYDTNVNIELKFEAASFPAVTICNANPYKNSMVKLIPSLRKTLASYENAMSKSATFVLDASIPVEKQAENLGPPRSKRLALDPDAVQVQRHFMRVRTEEEEKEFQTDRFQPVYTACTCRSKLSECNKLDEPAKQPDKFALASISYGTSAIDLCICFYDKRHKNGWPCYFAGNWYAETCSNCSISATCHIESETAATKFSPPVLYPTAEPVGCLCQNVSNVCVKLDKDDPIENYWDVVSSTVAPATTPKPTLSQEEVVFEKAQGFENMTDEVAITTKAKENLIFAMAAKPIHERIKLSHAMTDLIKMCSFNGKECVLKRDFKLHVDPVYGNCFVFNHDRNNSQSTNRAGPFYGLRLMLYVNTTDFLPTTESSGVRVAIHGQSEFPFPDIFGYSAPTGFISSLGIFMDVNFIFQKRLDRLPHPYGQCVKGFHESHTIYPGYDYNTEGCYRTCFQMELIRRCKCGDPRLPIPPGKGKSCGPEDLEGRICLEKSTAELGGFHGSFTCECPQPCQQNVYGLTYSASRWPAESYVIRGCNETHTECVNKYRKNAAMIEVYYEQLNYEKLQEIEAYGWVNLVADFGGQLGLWLGLSVITWFEFAVLVYDFVKLHFKFKREEKKQSHIETMQESKHEPTPKRTPSLCSSTPSNGYIRGKPSDFSEFARPGLDIEYRTDLY